MNDCASVTKAAELRSPGQAGAPVPTWFVVKLAYPLFFRATRLRSLLRRDQRHIAMVGNGYRVGGIKPAQVGGPQRAPP
jgi:hypothetical protein